jgi:hypothetical protein
MLSSISRRGEMNGEVEGEGRGYRIVMVRISGRRRGEERREGPKCFTACLDYTFMQQLTHIYEKVRVLRYHHYRFSTSTYYMILILCNTLASDDYDRRIMCNKR